MTPRSDPEIAAAHPAAGSPVHGADPAEVDGAAAANKPVRIGSGGTDGAQVAADQMLMLQLSVEGFHGAAWQKLIEHLYDYTRRTLHGFVVEGLLPVKVRQVLPGNQGAVAVARRFVEGTEDEFRYLRDEVIAETLAIALSYWRRRVVPKRMWDPGEGAQLRTYFVNVALKRMVKVAAKALRQVEQLADTDRTVARALAAAAIDPTETASLDSTSRRPPSRSTSRSPPVSRVSDWMIRRP